MKIERTCQYCGIRFSVKKSVIKDGRGKYHSKECFSKARENKIERVCLFCGKKFFVTPSGIEAGGGKYHSRECYNKDRENKTERICLYCGTRFVANASEVSRGGGKYHSQECCSRARKGKPSPSKGWKHTEATKKKMSLDRKGRIVSEEHRKSLSLASKGKPRYDLRGENSGAWKGGITDIKLRVKEGMEYQSWRSKVFVRDDFTCRDCGQKGGKLHAHHLKSFSILFKEARESLPLLDPYSACLLYAPLWDISNGKTLCEDCHKKTGNYLRNYTFGKPNLFFDIPAILRIVFSHGQFRKTILERLAYPNVENIARGWNRG